MNTMSEHGLIHCNKLVPGHQSYRFRQALDLDLKPGEMISIIGPSLEQKSCWLKTLCGLNADYSGELELLGTNAGQQSLQQWTDSRKGIAYVHADTALLSAVNGLINVLVPVMYHDIYKDDDRHKLTDRAIALVNEIDPDICLDELPAYISRQHQVKIATARALMLKPRVLALDNPFLYFDRDERKQFQSFINRKVEQGLSIIMLTQDIRYALGQSDRILYTDEDTVCLFDSLAACRQCKIETVRAYLEQYPDP